MTVPSDILGKSVTGVGGFYYISTIKQVTIQEGVVYINSHAFAGCDALTSITIPESVTHIGGSAFVNCKSLTIIQYGGTMAQWEAIAKDDDLSLGAAKEVICADGVVSLK